MILPGTATFYRLGMIGEASNCVALGKIPLARLGKAV
jgi:hypothetical protein